MTSKLGRFFEKLFSLDKYKYERIRIKKETIVDIMNFARTSYPNEFIAFLTGSVKDKVLIIDGLIYQPFSANRQSTYMRAVLPASSGAIGSVHSHPSPYSGPSSIDLQSFGKRGVIHLIINYPYNVENIRAYDSRANVLEFEIF